MESNNRLQEQIAFLLEIDKMKSIYRQTYLADGSRKENDAEHSWHLALMTVLLGEYAAEPYDVVRTMTMVLLHDLIEIDAGDTYAYDAKGYETKRARELAGADRIFSLLPKDQGAYFRSLWDEFEEGKTPEAKFANVVDRFQPMLLNDASQGISWEEHQVKQEQILARMKEIPKDAPIIGEKMKEIIERNRREGKIRE